MPVWAIAVSGAWFLVLLLFIARWLASGRSINPGPPQVKTRPNTRWIWPTATVLWIIVGVSLVVGAWNLNPALLGMCGVDDYPDLTVTRVEFAKSDDILITVANIGACPAPKSSSRLDWDTTADKVKVKAYVWPPADTNWLWVPIPALASGETRIVKKLWTGSYGLFHDVPKVWGFTVDYDRKIKEQDEYNNTLIFAP